MKKEGEKDWFSASRLVGMPSIPTTVQGLAKKAKREGWQSRERQGQGGGLEYAIESLPAAAQAAILLQRQGVTVAGPACTLDVDTEPPARRTQLEPLLDRDTLWSRYESRSQDARDAAAEKLRALQAVAALIEGGSGKMEALEIVATQVEVHPLTLHRWYRQVERYHPSDWLAALINRHAGRQVVADFTEDAWECFKADYLRLDQPTLAACYTRLEAAAKKHGWNIPSQKTVERRLQTEVRREIQVLLRQGEKALAQLYPCQERDKASLRAMEWINGDGYLHNVFVRFPDGEIGRPKTWFWQDVHSNMILGWRTDASENTDMIRLACLDVFERWGLPDNHVTIDNTRAAANKWMTGGIANRFRFKVKATDPLGILPGLGLQVHWATPGWGQSKPVERAFGVGGMGEYVDKHPALAGAWCGNNPTAKPENYGSRAIEWDVFIQTIAAGVATWNAKGKRRNPICRGQYSYQEVFLASYRESAIRRLTAEQRRLFLLTAEAINVAKDGTFKMAAGKGFGLGENRYGCDRLFGFAGQKIVVRFDPQDLHGSVHCYTLSGAYIGEAECILAAGFGDTSKAREHTKARRQMVKATKVAAAAEKRMSAIEVAALQPEVETPAPEPPQVIKGEFGRSKRTVNSDLVGQEDDRFDRAVEMMRSQRKKSLL